VLNTIRTALSLLPLLNQVVQHTGFIRVSAPYVREIHAHLRLPMESDGTEAAPRFENRLVLQDVSLSYDGRQPALDRIDLDIAKVASLTPQLHLTTRTAPAMY